ncbi:MAG: hypothetical protein V1673_00685 [Candidatus Omnitrophota bacterium]
MRSLLKNIYTFYRYDCCWPYAASFFLALIVFWQDFFVVSTRYRWASLVAYGIILAYYLYIIHLYFQGKTEKRNLKFFVGFLSFQTVIWGVVLALLFVVK